ncbi:ABC transporter permease [Parendozoicomonas haliclonae]|uniref:Arginine ABC transporter permease protein ArtQ n=1 Tax=Parendozoicomonas haliclonae TaxID=1960125 RepID=A0A1X7APP7_9GAMM|nr:ABC transporter permease [Parendozoicomonas haliclonae]SMA50301.1 Arginine ABC transporter permease protein ArtQ [Parendozoicomonas haliclonae]
MISEVIADGLFEGFTGQLLAGTVMTVKVTLAATFVGICLGLLGASARMSKFKPAKYAGDAYVGFIRGIPELLIIFLIYFGSTRLLMTIASWFGYNEYIELSPFIAGVIALGLTFGGYATEVFRGAFLAVHPGQKEAASALGMSKLRIFFRIQLPQVWRIALPGLGNLILVLMKDTALISVIGLEELTRKTQMVVTATREPFTWYFTAAVMYLSLTVVTTLILRYFENRSRRHERPVARTMKAAGGA